MANPQTTAEIKTEKTTTKNNPGLQGVADEASAIAQQSTEQQRKFNAADVVVLYKRIAESEDGGLATMSNENLTPEEVDYIMLNGRKLLKSMIRAKPQAVNDIAASYKDILAGTSPQYGPATALMLQQGERARQRQDALKQEALDSPEYAMQQFTPLTDDEAVNKNLIAMATQTFAMLATAASGLGAEAVGTAGLSSGEAGTSELVRQKELLDQKNQEIRKLIVQNNAKTMEERRKIWDNYVKNSSDIDLKLIEQATNAADKDFNNKINDAKLDIEKEKAYYENQYKNKMMSKMDADIQLKALDIRLNSLKALNEASHKNSLLKFYKDKASKMERDLMSTFLNLPSDSKENVDAIGGEVALERITGDPNYKAKTQDIFDQIIEVYVNFSKSTKAEPTELVSELSKVINSFFSKDHGLTDIQERALGIKLSRLVNSKHSESTLKKATNTILEEQRRYGREQIIYTKEEAKRESKAVPSKYSREDAINAIGEEDYYDYVARYENARRGKAGDKAAKEIVKEFENEVKARKATKD